MKTKGFDFDREKKIHKVVKGSDKSSKHRNQIYDLVEDDDDVIEEDETYYLDKKQLQKSDI